MKCLFLPLIIVPVFASSQQYSQTSPFHLRFREYENPFSNINSIPLPPGYERVWVDESSFGAYLRNLPLKKSRVVFLYNGEKKKNQDAQFAVIDRTIGKRDLQQCADAIMRLRADYFFERKQFHQINFIDNAGVNYKFIGAPDGNNFNTYLEKVFSHCGTLSLEKQLHKRKKMEEAMIGDVLIKGGSPGHAMIIVDMAINNEGRKIYLLAQGYMPAQDIHVVKNLGSAFFSPWYYLDNEDSINTPKWTFFPTQLRYW